MFAGIPLTGTAENAVITVTGPNGELSAKDSLTFIPDLGTCEISITPTKEVGLFGSVCLKEGDALTAEASVINNTDTEAEVILFMVCRKGDKAAAVKTERVELPADSSAELVLPLDWDIGEDIRVYLWDDRLRPLSENGKLISEHLIK